MKTETGIFYVVILINFLVFVSWANPEEDPFSKFARDMKKKDKHMKINQNQREATKIT